ncbi:little elongation complex subunit 1 isoform 2-T3 [Mantella aurantiaca]
MMPGENHSKTAGIASEAAGSCQNCTSLQQNLNEYVAALIALKQKIIDSDHLLAEYQQKCDDLKDAERENKTLRCQLEQILQKISPGEQTEEQLKSLRVELEEKTSSLDVVQPSHLQFIRAKEACKKCNMAKKKHAAKIKKIEENASKHIKNIKRLQQDKRIIERELKKIQKKLDDVQNKKTVNNAQTQVANDQPVVELDKKKIRILLEEIWGCIESSAENGDGDKLFLETNLRKGKDFNPDNSIPSLSHFSSSTLTCKFETSESTVINISHDSAKCTESNEIYTCTDAIKEYTGDKPNLTETSAKDVFVLQKLNDSHLINSNHESDMEELLQIMTWAKPLPHILSPLRFSPLTTKNLADSFLQVILKKIKTGKRSMVTTYLQALCRVYVGLCRQLGDIERARILCYSILKEDFPDPDRLLLFIVSSWNDIISTHGVVSKAIQAVLKNLAKDDVATCLSAYLNWEKTPPMNVTVLLSSVLMAVQLCPDGKFQQSEKYGEDLTDSIWEYIFAVDLLCSHRKWVWTHDKIISKELWPLLDKWVKRKKGNPNVSFISDLIVATVLRLVGHLCQMGIKEGYVTAVKNIGAVITAFLQHANDEGMSWGVQLACVYMLFDLAPSDPAAIYRTLQAWKESAKSDIPPAVVSCMQELESMCGPRK